MIMMSHWYGLYIKEWCNVALWTGKRTRRQIIVLRKIIQLCSVTQMYPTSIWTSQKEREPVGFGSSSLSFVMLWRYWYHVKQEFWSSNILGIKKVEIEISNTLFLKLVSHANAAEIIRFSFFFFLAQLVLNGAQIRNWGTMLSFKWHFHWNRTIWRFEGFKYDII